jgi:hypothetical protein
MSWTRPVGLRAQVQKLWERGEMLASLVSGESLFPRRLVLKGPTSAEMAERFDAVRAWVAELRAMPHCRIEMREFRHRVFGANAVPDTAWIDSLDEALALLGKRRELTRFNALLELTRQRQPQLLAWLSKRPLRALELAGKWSRLLAIVAWVAERAQQAPRPGVYLRQVDIPGVHSKFIEAHRGVLAEWLDLVLPPAAIDASATGVSGFARRYGFRDKPVRIRLRILDPAHSRLPTRLRRRHQPRRRQLRPPRPRRRARLHHRERNQLPGFPGRARQPDPLRRRLRLRDAGAGAMAVALPHPLLGRHRHARLRHPRPAARALCARRFFPHGPRDAARF